MTDEIGSIEGSKEDMPIEDVIAAHMRRSDDQEQFMTDITRAVKYLAHRLCTICELTEPECKMRHMDHLYKPMTATDFLLLTMRRRR